MVREVLAQLNETIPESLPLKEAFTMLSQTGEMLGRMSDADLLEIKTADDTLHPTQRFYMLMVRYVQNQVYPLGAEDPLNFFLDDLSFIQGAVAYWHKPELLPFLACRVIQLSLEQGLSKDSIMAFVQYASILCNQTMITDIKGAYRIGKIAMTLFKRFNSPELVARVYFCYYGFIAVQ